MSACNDPSPRGRLRLRLPPRRRLGSEGAAAVEFALIFPALVLLLYGLMEVARALYSWNSLQLMADEASRWAAVRPAASAADVATVARRFGAGIAPDDLTVTVDTAAAGPAGQRTVDVRLDYAYRLLAPGIARSEPIIVMRARSRMPVLDF